jgi:hypothetical protein
LRVLGDTQKFIDLALDKAITIAFEIYYLDVNGYRVVKEIGELVPDILTIAIFWLKGAKAARAGSVAVATEEIAAKEALEKLEKESIEELQEKAAKEAEEKLDDLADEILDGYSFRQQKVERANKSTIKT